MSDPDPIPPGYSWRSSEYRSRSPWWHFSHFFHNYLSLYAHIVLNEENNSLMHNKYLFILINIVKFTDAKKYRKLCVRTREMFTVDLWLPVDRTFFTIKYPKQSTKVLNRFSVNHIIKTANFCCLGPYTSVYILKGSRILCKQSKYDNSSYMFVVYE